MPALARPGRNPATPELSAEESLKVIEEQRATTVRSLLFVNPAPILLAWGVAWTAGLTLEAVGTAAAPAPR